MFKDKSLVPAEAVRLAALGALAPGPKDYASLAADIRQFTTRVAGPSLDLLGAPVELLRYEGLIEPVEGSFDNGTESLLEAGPLQLTEAGLEALKDLLRATVRAPVNDIGKLVIALKMRFLQVLDREEQEEQLDMLADLKERELARLRDLRGQHENEETLLREWLDLEIAETSRKLEWLERCRDAV